MTQDIHSILTEERKFVPPKAFTPRRIRSASQLESLRQSARSDLEGFWGKLAKTELDWQTPFSHVLDRQNAPHFRWFEDGNLNVSFNCLDRHLSTRGNKTAIIFEGEQGDTETLTYHTLYERVCRFANALKKQGVGKGDRVILYMPMIPEAVIAMQACARIGAIHSVVFGGFSAEALKDRIEDTKACCLITADGGHRGGKIIELKKTADRALELGGATVKNVIVFQRTGKTVPMISGRDHWWHEIVSDCDVACEPEWVNSEHPLFILYTSGSTGKPKGLQHSSGGYLLGATMTCQWVFDLDDSDIFWCTADVGWITGHTYVAYGPLSNGATIMMYEGAPTVPDGGRFWKICEKHRVTVFYTAPTAIRALMKLGDDVPNRYDLSSLRLLGTVGEPINPEAWMWYHRVIGQSRCPIVDTWWQTETGAIMASPIPGVTATKPGSCTQPLPGIDLDIVDSEGNSIQASDKGGYLVVRQPWPSMARTIWGDDQRYVDTYWSQFDGKYYVAGDSARRDSDGYFWIMGRLDDVLNVSGHRLGTMEIESALVAHPCVVEAAVVGFPHDIKGEGIHAFVVTKPSETQQDSDIVETLKQWVVEQIGAIARPDVIVLVDNLPKTRSGKIMRRLLRSIACKEKISQDTSTLENETILSQIRAAEPN
ncbi:MAG: acetate--CoA ligase [Gammaproteobacteria bacterium]|nr:MAG: acetate--CoA ligase [Gammaproteobacteria bacterium]